MKSFNDRYMGTDRRVLGIFSFAIFFLILVIYFSYLNLDRYSDATRWNLHTYAVLDEAAGMLDAIEDIKASQRRFLETGKNDALEPYHSGMQEFTKRWYKAKGLTSDNHEQQERFGKLMEAYELWLKSSVDLSISLRRMVEHDFQDAEINGALEKGAIQWRVIDAMLDEIEQEERGLLESRSKDMDSMFSFAKLTLIFGGILGAIVAAFSALWASHISTRINNYRQKIHQMAFYDSLTSLSNRALFIDRLQQMLADVSWHGQLAGVMLLDLDRFKKVNDTLGHPAGDELLREVAARLTCCVRGYDTVARLGGDEFAILLPEIRTGDDLGRVASKIIEAINQPFLLNGVEVFVSCSIGIALYPEDGSEADDLLKYADSAMYFAKRSGRNNFRFYSKDLTVSANEKLTLETDLRHGFARGELELYYQPKVNLADGLLAGSEALLRWHHPLRGMVPPDKFIPIAEDSGLIVEIGEWVLRCACRVACEWNLPGTPLHKVAINLSARQFQSGDLLKTVRFVLAETGCHAAWIELEITESLLLDQDGGVLEMLAAFREMGITIAIDDFGTGYSSLSYLANFPIDTLKIDRSFISSLSKYGRHSELVKAIISIAKSLGQQVVAEGVETAEQAALLRTYGCQLAQGYFYGKPMPMQIFENFASAAVSHNEAEFVEV